MINNSFDFVLLLLAILICVFHREINHLMNKEVDPDKPYTAYNFTKDVIISIPLISIVVRDMLYNSFSFQKLGVPKSMNKHVDYILLTSAAYGMIQVLAQDTGLKTGIFQRNTVQQALLFAPIALGSGYGVTSNRSMALIAVLGYYHLKYAVSNNVTSPVCFEEV